MDYSLKELGPKFYGIYLFSKMGLFKETFVIFENGLSDTKKKEMLIKTKINKKKNKVAIRFYKKDVLNPPFYFGSFSIQDIIDYTNKHKEYTSFVHKLIIPVNTCQLYYNGNKIIISVFPGIRMPAQEMRLKSEPVDFIEINNKRVIIYRYKKRRNAININKKVYFVKPNKINYLRGIAQKILNCKPKLDILLNESNPLLCDFNLNKKDKINFMGLHYQLPFDFNLDFDFNCKIIKSKFDLFNYKGNKPIYLDFTIKFDDPNYLKIITVLKNKSEVYLNCLTTHLAIILRELNINVKHSNYINVRNFQRKVYKIKD